MPLPKTSLSSLKTRTSFLGLSCTLLLLGLTSCQVMDESKVLFDFPLTSDYRPIIQREEGFAPQRLLVLPVTGEITSTYRGAFEQELLSWLGKPTFWTITEYNALGNGRGAMGVERFEAYKKAQQVKADAIVFVKIISHDPYDPIRYVVDVAVERTDTQKSVLNTTFDFNTRNQNVADSARRFYKKYMPRTFGSYDAPSKSNYITTDNEAMARFAGAHTARMLAEAYAPAPLAKSGK
jgi:hypothetical protein